MAKRLISAALGAALLLAAAPASAVTNGGFEDATITPLSGITAGGLGNFTSGWDGWNNNGLQVDITDASPGTDPFVAGGNHMAALVFFLLNEEVGMPPSLPEGAWLVLLVGGALLLAAVFGWGVWRYRAWQKGRSASRPPTS